MWVRNHRISLNGMLSENDKEAIRSVYRVVEAMRNLRQLLEKREESLLQAVGVAEPANDYTSAVRVSHMSEEREDLHEALFLLEQRRRESRIAAFRSALDHGVSINELARIWGFSRQMASRYAREARGETEQTTSSPSDSDSRRDGLAGQI
jgi:hypothetical protein